MSAYPTMSMILNGLAANLGKIVFYFQVGSLWKNLGIVSTAAIPDDVYDQEGVSRKRQKSRLLFSIRYRQENGGNCAAFGRGTHDVNEAQRLREKLALPGDSLCY
jgi:hypothetical protein